MTEETEIGAELTKINFVLENVVAMLLRDAGGKAADVDAFSEEMLRQFALPGTQTGSGTADPEAIHELAAHRLAMFFAGVKERLRSAE